MRSEDIYKHFGISERLLRFAAEAEEALSEKYAAIDRTADFNQLKVLRAMQESHVSSECMNGTSGYGYFDTGRDTLERVYSAIFGTEEALVRSQIVSGTHALSLALYGNTSAGDTIFSPCGMPYDTMQTILGIKGHAKGSLKDCGVSFDQVPLCEDGSFDYREIPSHINEHVKLILIQRSRGYAMRKSLSVSEIGELIKFLRKLREDLIIMVDDCYGEYTEMREPTEVGADMCVGSLIKNPGGGIAPVGGYIAGTADCVERAASRLTAPGLGREVGPSLGHNRAFYQGTFLAPIVTAASLKGACFAAFIFSQLGFSCFPEWSDERHDIVQSVVLGSDEKLISFCRGVQEAAAVDSFVKPEPAPMPGYESEIIMAAGGFVSGSSIELSADGPLREPYTVFLQGGLTYPHAKLGALSAAQALMDDGFI